MSADSMGRRAAAITTPAVQRRHWNAKVGGQVLDRPQAIIGGSADRQWLLLSWVRRSCSGPGHGVVLAGAGGGGEREFGVSGDGAADAVVGPDNGQDQDDGFVQGAAPGVAVGVRRASGAAVLGAGGAELGDLLRAIPQDARSGRLYRSACQDGRAVFLTADCPDRGRRVNGAPAGRRKRSAAPTIDPPSSLKGWQL